MSPWLIGFSVFFGYPLVMSVYLSFTHYDLLSPPKWIGLANYKYLFTQDPQVGPAVKNTLWLIGIMVPLQVLFAFGIAMMLARARRGAGFFRTVFYLPALAPPVAATMAFVYLLNPRASRDRRAALVPVAAVVEAVADAAQHLGRRQPDDHLPGVDPRRAAAALRVG